jgi:hypothetical protein
MIRLDFELHGARRAEGNLLVGDTSQSLACRLSESDYRFCHGQFGGGRAVRERLAGDLILVSRDRSVRHAA